MQLALAKKIYVFINIIYKTYTYGKYFLLILDPNLPPLPTLRSAHVSKLTKDLDYSVTSPHSLAIQDFKTKITIDGGHEEGGLYRFDECLFCSVVCHVIALPLEIHYRLRHHSLDRLK